MSAETTTKPEATPAPAKQEPVKPVNQAVVKKAILLGREMGRQIEVMKADVARKMFELISSEPREVIVQAFVEGASLTPKGAQTYLYNCNRKAAAKSS